MSRRFVMLDRLVAALDLTEAPVRPADGQQDGTQPDVLYRGSGHHLGDGYEFAFGTLAALEMRHHPDTPDWPCIVHGIGRIDDGRPIVLSYAEGDLTLSVHADDTRLHAWVFGPDEDDFGTRWALEGYPELG